MWNSSWLITSSIAPCTPLEYAIAQTFQLADLYAIVTTRSRLLLLSSDRKLCHFSITLVCFCQTSLPFGHDCSSNYSLVHSWGFCPYCPCFKGELCNILISAGKPTGSFFDPMSELGDHCWTINKRLLTPGSSCSMLSTPGVPWPD